MTTKLARMYGRWNFAAGDLFIYSMHVRVTGVGKPEEAFPWARLWKGYDRAFQGLPCLLQVDSSTPVASGIYEWSEKKLKWKMLDRSLILNWAQTPWTFDPHPDWGRPAHYGWRALSHSLYIEVGAGGSEYEVCREPSSPPKPKP